MMSGCCARRQASPAAAAWLRPSDVSGVPCMLRRPCEPPLPGLRGSLASHAPAPRARANRRPTPLLPPAVQNVPMKPDCGWSCVNKGATWSAVSAGPLAGGGQALLCALQRDTTFTMCVCTRSCSCSCVHVHLCCKACAARADVTPSYAHSSTHTPLTPMPSTMPAASTQLPTRRARLQRATARSTRGRTARSPAPRLWRRITSAAAPPRPPAWRGASPRPVHQTLWLRPRCPPCAASRGLAAPAAGWAGLGRSRRRAMCRRPRGVQAAPSSLTSLAWPAATACSCCASRVSGGGPERGQAAVCSGTAWLRCRRHLSAPAPVSLCALPPAAAPDYRKCVSVVADNRFGLVKVAQSLVGSPIAYTAASPARWSGIAGGVCPPGAPPSADQASLITW